MIRPNPGRAALVGSVLLVAVLALVALAGTLATPDPGGGSAGGHGVGVEAASTSHPAVLSVRERDWRGLANDGLQGFLGSSSLVLFGGAAIFVGWVLSGRWPGTRAAARCGVRGRAPPVSA